MDRLLSSLTDEQRDIIVLWAIEGYTLEEVGVIVGNKYRGRPLRGTTIQYHKDIIREKLRLILESR
jgi:hypothetical protein